MPEIYIYGDENSFPYPGKQSFSPKTGLALRNGLRYDRKLTRWMFLFAEAAFDCKLLREYNEYKAGPASPSSGPVRHDQNLSNEPYSFAFNLGLSFRLVSHPLDK